MYVHFRCQPCKRIYGVHTENSLKANVATPLCRSCGEATNRTGIGAKRLRKGAIELTAATLSRTNRLVAAQKTREKLRDQKIQERRHLAAAELSKDVEVNDDDGDDDFLIVPSHGFNIRMRLTQWPYNARKTYGYDSSCVLSARADITGTAGRLNLNTIMGRHCGAPTPAKYSAWRHAGTTPFKTNKYASSEWCHLIADSLGGPSEPRNVVAASYSANTYMAALEALLQGQAACRVEVTVRCSAAHIGEWIFYRVAHRASGQSYQVEIDGQAAGFCATDLQNVQVALQTWLAARGIVVALSP